MADVAVTEPKVGSKKKLIIIISITALLAISGAVGVTLVLKSGKDKEVSASEKKTEAAEDKNAGEGKEGHAEASTYVSLAPPFVVNFQDEKKHTKFLKAEISVEVNTAKAQEAMTLHTPAVRNSLVMLLSRQVFEALTTGEGKEKLRADALTAVREVIKQQAGDKVAEGIKDLFFSSLVMQ